MKMSFIRARWPRRPADDEFEVRELVEGTGAIGVFPVGLEWASAFLTRGKHGLRLEIHGGFAHIVDGNDEAIGAIYLEPIAKLIELMDRKRKPDNL